MWGGKQPEKDERSRVGSWATLGPVDVCTTDGPTDRGVRAMGWMGRAGFTVVTNYFVVMTLFPMCVVAAEYINCCQRCCCCLKCCPKRFCNCGCHDKTDAELMDERMKKMKKGLSKAKSMVLVRGADGMDMNAMNASAQRLDQLEAAHKRARRESKYDKEPMSPTASAAVFHTVRLSKGEELKLRQRRLKKEGGFGFFTRAFHNCFSELLGKMLFTVPMLIFGFVGCGVLVYLIAQMITVASDPPRFFYIDQNLGAVEAIYYTQFGEQSKDSRMTADLPTNAIKAREA